VSTCTIPHHCDDDHDTDLGRRNGGLYSRAPQGVVDLSTAIGSGTTHDAEGIVLRIDFLAAVDHIDAGPHGGLNPQ
jgi:hypothetical protein